MLPRERISAALARAAPAATGERARTARAAPERRVPALVAFMTAGYPDPGEFLSVLRAVARAADAVDPPSAPSGSAGTFTTILRGSGAAAMAEVTGGGQSTIAMSCKSLETREAPRPLRRAPASVVTPRTMPARWSSRGCASASLA